MGVWLIAKDRIKIEPEVDEKLIREYLQFSRETCPKDYLSEKFFNTWFFDENNNLISHEGKFAEPEIWYGHLRDNFFRPRGYAVKEDVEIIGEVEEGFSELCAERLEEYKRWEERRKRITGEDNYFW